MLKEKRIIYRIGDKVKIKEPNVFCRCGYPFDKKLAIEKLITTEEKNKIFELVGATKPTNDLFYYESYPKQQTVEEILDSLAYLKLKINSFGGRERRIYTDYKLEYKDRIGTINSKRVVKTGDYSPGGYSYDGECDPPFLSNEKSHVILALDFYDSFYVTPYLEPIEIEQKWVEKTLDLSRV